MALSLRWVVSYALFERIGHQNPVKIGNALLPLEVFCAIGVEQLVVYS